MAPLPRVTRPGSPRAVHNVVFAGDKSATSDRQALAKAQEMERGGASRDDIWRETGWWRPEHDGKWRYEIDDRNAGLAPRFAQDLHAAVPKTVVVGTPRPGTRFYDPRPLPEVLRHPDFYAAYPGAAVLPPDRKASGANVGVIVSRSVEDGAGFTKPARDQVSAADAARGENTGAQHMEIDAPTLRSAIEISLHESNHFIAHVEGFARGTDGNDPGYATNPEEQIARAVETRRMMTPAQRRATPPWQTIEANTRAESTPAPQRPQTPGREDWKHPDGVKGPDGLSKVAKDVAGDVDAQRAAHETALRGMMSDDPRNSSEHLGIKTGDLKAWARREWSKPDHGFKPSSPQDVQRGFDAIDAGSGGKTDGSGQVWRGPGNPPPYTPPAKPVPKSWKGSDAGGDGLARFAAASSAYHAGTVPTPSAAANHRRGFQNPQNLRAALIAQGKVTTNVKG